MEGLDVVVMDLEYERNSEISIAIFENSSFLPHDPLATVKIQLKDLIHKCENKPLMENEISKVFFNFKKKGNFEVCELDISCSESTVFNFYLKK